MSGYEKLQNLISDIDELIKKGADSSLPEFDAWKMKVRRFLTEQYGGNSLEMREFKKILFSPTAFWTGDSNEEIHRQCVDSCKKGLQKTKAILNVYLDEMKSEEPQNSLYEMKDVTDFSKIFIVHGHDGELKESVARIIEKQGIKPIILSEQPNKGSTIIEKFEEYSNVDCAICLFTADDNGKANKAENYNPRARQNVVFETGYFIGKLGREHVIILSDKGVEIPSDLSGVVYTDTANWQIALLKDLNAIGYAVDANKLID